jgi:hypothetical protein
MTDLEIKAETLRMADIFIIGLFSSLPNLSQSSWIQISPIQLLCDLSQPRDVSTSIRGALSDRSKPRRAFSVEIWSLPRAESIVEVSGDKIIPENAISIIFRAAILSHAPRNPRASSQSHPGNRTSKVSCRFHCLAALLETMESATDSVTPVILEIRATRIEIRATRRSRQKSEQCNYLEHWSRNTLHSHKLPLEEFEWLDNRVAIRERSGSV